MSVILANVRAAMLIVGVALIATGVVWIFQGTGMLKGSFMTGQAFWAWMGGAAVVLGLPIVTWSRRGRRS